MATNLREVVETVRYLSAAERREVLARLWHEQRSRRETQFGLRFASAKVSGSRPTLPNKNSIWKIFELLLCGALARRESEADGAYEIYGPDRTYYVTMTPAREFAALLSSWAPERPPHEVNL